MSEEQKPEAIHLADSLEDFAENLLRSKRHSAHELVHSAAKVLRQLHEIVKMFAPVVLPPHPDTARLQHAVWRLEDLLKDDDPQAWKEARKFLERLKKEQWQTAQPQADALDTERLDWLIEQGCSNGVVYEFDKSFWMAWLDGYDAHKDEHQIGRYHTAREAIDAAIAAAKENK